MTLTLVVGVTIVVIVRVSVVVGVMAMTVWVRVIRVFIMTLFAARVIPLRQILRVDRLSQGCRENAFREWGHDRFWGEPGGISALPRCIAPLETKRPGQAVDDSAAVIGYGWGTAGYELTPSLAQGF